MKLPFETIERELLTKKDTILKQPKKVTSEHLLEYGVLCLNKPAGPTSHQATDYVKQIFNVSKAGHGGTLDPQVTGVLPIALNKATRIVQTLLPAGKEYICLMHIHKPLSESIIHKTLNSFKGTITQLPPVRSAVKREERQREIYYIEILEIKDQDVLFKVGCQGGTYIRRLCDDFGKITKVGAHMAQLIRTKAGPFNDKDWHSLQDIKDSKDLTKILKPIEYAIQHLGKIYVQDNTEETLIHGADLHVPGITHLENNINNNDLVAILNQNKELICIGLAKMTSEEILNESKGLAVKTTKVFKN